MAVPPERPVDALRAMLAAGLELTPSIHDLASAGAAGRSMTEGLAGCGRTAQASPPDSRFSYALVLYGDDDQIVPIAHAMPCFGNDLEPPLLQQLDGPLRRVLHHARGPGQQLLAFIKN